MLTGKIQGEKFFGDEIMQTILDAILLAGKPEKVFIFGSYAKQTQTKDSDIDIAIIENTELKKGKRAVKYFQRLKNLSIPKDIIVFTPEEFEYRKLEVNSLPYRINKEGVLIFG
ncbi:MAG: nucleotidyltransferase domain-containing protein [Leptospiraceae bacterium]|nr:nucleotidyltransferase domain-containing protein [Leptospiraceae bacterium]